MRTKTVIISIVVVFVLASSWYIIKKRFFPDTWNNPDLEPLNVTSKVFPLKLGSKGGEVRVVQQYLNMFVLPPVSLLVEDGIWGVNTEERFRELVPNATEVDRTTYGQMYTKAKEYYKEALK